MRFYAMPYIALHLFTVRCLVMHNHAVGGKPTGIKPISKLSPAMLSDTLRCVTVPCHSLCFCTSPLIAVGGKPTGKEAIANPKPAMLSCAVPYVAILCPPS